ncbi:MAG: hypothetical protein CMO55_11650 [Verrucomicrobiales bacterium]|nr:hypothetical protein [Verrucomicrobiales bacterium]
MPFRFFLLFLSGFLFFSLSHAQDRPNILWITTEDISRELGCYGDEYADTPNLDKLAENGIRYTRFFAESPMCAPSRSTIITGIHNGPLGSSQMRSLHRIPERIRPFSAYLRDAGYYCVNNSKTDYNLARDDSGENKEFVDEGWDQSSPQAHWKNAPEGKPFFCIFNYVDTHQSRASRNDYDYFVEKVQSKLAEERIHDPDKAPLPPHYPDSKIFRKTVARYHDCITVLDDYVGNVLAELEEAGHADDTIVFFYSDHGAGMPTGKACVSDYGLRCPLIIHFPDKYRHLAPSDNGSVSDRLTCFSDLAPTMLHLLGLTVPSEMSGVPFLGATMPEAPKYVHGTRDRMDETLETTRWITDGQYLLVRSYQTDLAYDQQTVTSFYNGNGEGCQEIRDLKEARKLNDMQLHFWGDRRPAVMLFDSEADPWNTTDLATDPAHFQRVDEMLAALETELVSKRDLGFWPEPELADAEKEAPARELAFSRDRYPIERILETAKLQSVKELKARLSENHFVVRYWAILALANIGADARGAIPQLKECLTDESASVRIEAATLLPSLTDSPESVALLTRELDSPNEWAACRAARGLEEIGEAARPSIEKMKEALDRGSSGHTHKPKGPEAINYGFEFSLITALRELGAYEKE